MIAQALGREEIEAIVRGAHADPFRVLGAHAAEVEGKTGRVIRAFLPDAQRAWVVLSGAGSLAARQASPAGAPAAHVFPMTRVHRKGFFEGLLPTEDVWGYRLRVEYEDGTVAEFLDCYAFSPVLTDFDLYLIGEGKHSYLYQRLGAHPWRHQGVDGVLFAVWAPNASRVSVVGDFDLWDGRRYPMRSRGPTGVWELFIPELTPGLVYKYEVRTREAHIYLKSDPLGFAFEVRPNTASIVHDLDRYTWEDPRWMEERPRQNWLDRPMAIYEVHLGSWRRVPEEENRPLTYRELADTLIPYVKGMGFTHIELLPVMEHPLDESWGYQVTGFYAPTGRHGTPDDFRYLVDRCHQERLGLFLDWVPAHFPRDAYGLSWFDGTALYEHADPRLGEHRDWGTLIFNYGRNEVRNFLLSNALFWLDQYHADGLRVDAVASMLYLDYSRRQGEWVPNRHGGRENLEAIEFLHRFNELTHGQFPGSLTMAEESTSWPAVSRPVHLGGLGFTLKWNMGWMHDALSYFSVDPLFRKFHHQNLTFSLLYAFHENFILPLSHDEVVHGKGSLIGRMPGAGREQFANLRLLLGYQYTHPGKKLLFMGSEFGQRPEWNSNGSLDWHVLQYESHRGIHEFVRALNWIYRSEPALHEVDFEHQGFEWIDFGDAEHGVISYLRRARNPSDFLVVVLNLTPVARQGYRVGVPEGGFYREILNSDAAFFWGFNMGNAGGLPSEPVPWHGRPHCLTLTLPPLSVLILKPTNRD